MGFILAIDQGTTSSRAIVFDGNMRPVAQAQQEFTQHFPHDGWVEHDSEEIWRGVLACCRAALEKAGVSAGDLAGIGITNQRETTLVWERESGRVLGGRAIVWQDRRTSRMCDDLRAAGAEEVVRAQTGLLLDPYFSGTKVKWLLDHHAGARAAARAGKLLFGTVDSYLMWRLSGGKVHVSDASNAARTMLYDIHKGAWSAEICALLDIPMEMLPEVGDCAGEFGRSEPSLLGAAVPLRGSAGDQQAATMGQACFAPGMMKSTYGTGCFALLNTGERAVMSGNRLLTTIAYRLNGRTTYALEGSIFQAGSVVQWLRDGLGILGTAQESGALAAKADPQQRVVLVPAFTGLGAPYWNATCRGAVFGLRRNSGAAELARAALESVGFQTRDLLEAMQADSTATASERTVLRVDGGMAASDQAMQFLADILGAEVDRPEVLETTALGAAWLAGMQAGIYAGPEAFSESWALERRFEPQLDTTKREALYAGWKRAVEATILAG